MTFIDQHADMFGVEPICRVLTQHGCPISTSTYYAAKNRPPSARAVRDAELDEHITRIHADNYGVYGARKIWHQLQREGHQVARGTIERRMRALGLRGARRGKKVRTTMADPSHERAADRLQRDFTATRPNAAWVADFTHVAAWCGAVYVAFVVDVYSRAIVGWAASLTKHTTLVLDALDMALWRRGRIGRPGRAGTDPPQRCRAIHVFPVHQASAGGRDRRLRRQRRHALMESQIGLYKTELIKPPRTLALPGRRRTGHRRMGGLVQRHPPALSDRAPATRGVRSSPLRSTPAQRTRRNQPLRSPSKSGSFRPPVRAPERPRHPWVGRGGWSRTPTIRPFGDPCRTGQHHAPVGQQLTFHFSENLQLMSLSYTPAERAVTAI
ncbi:IS3 family transposase [Nonomuraea longispora]|uniref:IS3 family transposase n=1 Tax=Nonomuraea longispora TaxID=1848320 RepID=A0A4R4N7V8_9ACTN|nr:IS3 family transposase [Nonomuraea longispora]TDC03363.1 IS3 family transposase [Nonomuraea longispora]